MSMYDQFIVNERNSKRKLNKLFLGRNVTVKLHEPFFTKVTIFTSNFFSALTGRPKRRSITKKQHFQKSTKVGSHVVVRHLEGHVYPLMDLIRIKLEKYVHASTPEEKSKIKKQIIKLNGRLSKEIANTSIKVGKYVEDAKLSKIDLRHPDEMMVGVQQNLKWIDALIKDL